MAAERTRGASLEASKAGLGQEVFLPKQAEDAAQAKVQAQELQRALRKPHSAAKPHLAGGLMLGPTEAASLPL